MADSRIIRRSGEHCRSVPSQYVLITRSQKLTHGLMKWQFYHCEFSSFIWHQVTLRWGFPGGSDSKGSACNARDPGAIPGLGRSPGEGNGNNASIFVWRIPMDRGGWQATVRRVTKSRTWLSDSQFHYSWVTCTVLGSKNANGMEKQNPSKFIL